jgi:hypothetical protein
VNKFWSQDGLGVSPLLVGMGASTLAFFPTRRAVMVEGPCDILLHPQMFREALAVDSLGFQFVHGLSTAAPILAPLIHGDDHHIVYLIDGDPGGVRIADDLVANGVTKDRIVIVRNSDSTAVELEDFVDPAILLDAANRLIERYHPGSPRVSRTELRSARRMESLEAAYLENAGVPLPKVELAYEFLEILDANPAKSLLDGRRKERFKRIAGEVLKAFQDK